MMSYPSTYKITPSIFMTSYPIHMLSPYCFHDNRKLYLTSHPPYLTSQPLCLCHHTEGTHICIDVSLYPWHHKCVSHHTWHTYDIIPNLHHITFTLYDINDHVLWHHKYCIHDIRSPLYDIKSSLGYHTTLCMTSSPLYLTSRPLYLCHHNHRIYDITATIWMVLHPVYMWHHITYIYDIISTKYDITTLCVDDTTLGICVTSFALQMTSRTVYHPKPQDLWSHIHFRHDITPPVSDIAPTVSLSSQPLHWYHTHFWMTSHPPSVWHHMHYIEYHIQSLCHHTTLLISQPLYVKPHPVCKATYTLSMRHHSQ